MNVDLNDFFNFESKEPINRLAYTDEDIQYKEKVIKKMQELGMTITMDKVGNICGKLEFGNHPENKTIAIGSHTDSVYNGGQYDGPVGVITGLKVAENLKQSKKSFNGTILVCIYQCEESSRFGNACLGSKYLNGNISETDFNNIHDQKNLSTSLSACISQYKNKLKQDFPEIQEVDKIFTKVHYSLESHIEQYKILNKLTKKEKKPIIGIVSSVGSAVRIKYIVQGKSGHTGSTPMKKRRNAVDATSYIGKSIRKLGRNYEKEGLGRASQVEINTPGHNQSFNQIPNFAEGYIDIRLLGENSPEHALNDFNNIIEQASQKTKTNISYNVVSQGTPIITDSILNKQLENIAAQLDIKSLSMSSPAGQDTLYIPADCKTMIFIPSKGGSHNPKESTKIEYIETSILIFTQAVQNLLKETLRDTIITESTMPPSPPKTTITPPNKINSGR